MIDSVSLITYRRSASDTLMSHGNKLLDRTVFYYLMDRINLHTGIIGVPYKVSYARIALDISEKGGRGTRRKLVTYSRTDVSNAIDRLCQYGLYERLSNAGKDVLMLKVFIEINEESI